jgi:hypothetical protein
MADAGIPGSCSSARMACAFCRKRKLRCDRQMPKCNSCQRFGYDCEYGPPKGQAKRDQRVNSNPSHVRRLEDRLGKPLLPSSDIRLSRSRGRPGRKATSANDESATETTRSGYARFGIRYSGYHSCAGRGERFIRTKCNSGTVSGLAAMTAIEGFC